MVRRAHFIEPDGCVRFEQFLVCIFVRVCRFCLLGVHYFNVFHLPSIDLLKMKLRPPYLKTQFVPRSKHFSSRLEKSNQFMM
jgi:hypothetical protein